MNYAHLNSRKTSWKFFSLLEFKKPTIQPANQPTKNKPEKIVSIAPEDFLYSYILSGNTENFIFLLLIFFFILNYISFYLNWNRVKQEHFKRCSYTEFRVC